MKHILVTGSNGQLGREIQEVVACHNNSENVFYFTDKGELSITEYDSFENFMRKSNVKFDAIINCAAYTNVEEAEGYGYTDCCLANWLAVKNLSAYCSKHSIKLIHISTDYVFDGERNRPYKRFSDCHALNAYGNTKYLGEEAIRGGECSDYIIIRTSWLYSKYGNNFVKKVISRLKDNATELFGTIDEVSAPTSAKDLAEFIITAIIENENNFKLRRGTYHFSNLGIASRYDFVSSICEYYGADNVNVVPKFINDFNFKAIRPHYSVLDLSETIKDFNYTIPEWRNSLKNVIKEILK